MNQKKRHRMTAIRYILIALLIFLVALAGSGLLSGILQVLHLPVEQSGVIADMISGVIAAIAAALVILQLRDSERERIRQNDIEEASFLLQYNQAFIQDPNMAEVESLLEEQAHYGRKEPIITDSNRQKFVNYLVYLEGLAPLVLKGILSLDHIDDLMAYRFFLAVNNPEIQEKELKRFAGDYRGCFKLYKVWKEYRESQKYDILLMEYSLDTWEKFSEYAE